MDTLPQFSLGTAALLILGILALLIMLRGVARILWGTLTLCIAGYAAFFAWQRAPFSEDLRWTAPVAAFCLTAFLLRSLTRVLFSPLRDAEASAGNARSPLRWVFSLLFGLIPATALWFGGATLLRHFGSIEEIRRFAESRDATAPSTFLSQLKDTIDRTLPADWFSLVDPLTDDSRLKLVKLLATADDPPPKAIPVLEETQIRQIITSDPELRLLAQQGRYAEILRDPRLDRLLENDNLRQVLHHSDL